MCYNLFASFVSNWICSHGTLSSNRIAIFDHDVIAPVIRDNNGDMLISSLDNYRGTTVSTYVFLSCSRLEWKVYVRKLFLFFSFTVFQLFIYWDLSQTITFLWAPQSKLLSWIWKNSVSYVFGPSCTMYQACCTVTQDRSLSVLFRLRQAVVTYERHTSQLRVSVGDIGRHVLRTCRSTVLGPRCQCSGKRRHHGWEDIVQSEREVTVSAQSQVSSTVPAVSWCTGQLWTATCSQCHHCTTRFDDIRHFSDITCSTCWRILTSPKCCYSSGTDKVGQGACPAI